MAENNEHKEQSLNLEALKELKQKQQERDFDSVLKIFESFSEEEQAEFLTEFADKDPVYAEIIAELRKYISWSIDKLKNEAEKREDKTPLTWETTTTFLDQNKDFRAFLTCFQENKWGIVVLTQETYVWLSRYESNKEPLATILWQAEINKAKSDMNDKLRYMRTAMIHSPENLDKAQSEVREEFKKKEQEIIQKYLPQTDVFVNLLKNTDIWKKIMTNTTLNNYNEWLKANIVKNIWYKENSESNLTNEIETKTKKVIWRIWEIQSDLNKEIAELKKSQEPFKQLDYLNWERVIYQDIPEKYWNIIKEELKSYAFDVWKTLIQNNAPVVQDWKVFNLPLWDWKEIVLDFWDLWDIKGKSSEEILKVYESKFDDIYKDTLISKIIREMTSKKWLIDFSWTIIWWWVTLLASNTSLWASIPASAIIFTVVENWYKAWMYEAFDIDDGWSSWLWIDLKNDTTNDILRKKWFELASNALLFSLFRWTWWAENKILSKINNPEITNTLNWRIASYWAKTWVEWVFFTYFSVVSNNLQDNLKNWWNTQEIIDSLTNVWNMEDLIKLYAFNLWFITLVKWWAKWFEEWAIFGYEKLLKREIQKLKEKWYTLVDWVFYNWNNQVKALPIKDFEEFIKLNKKLTYLATDTYAKPENW